MRPVTPLHPTPPTDTLTEIAATMDTLLADIALDEPDLSPGTHTAIRMARDRYRDWAIDNHRPLGGGEAG